MNRVSVGKARQDRENSLGLAGGNKPSGLSARGMLPSGPASGPGIIKAEKYCLNINILGCTGQTEVWLWVS